MLLIVAGVVFLGIVFRKQLASMINRSENKIMNTSVSLQAISSIADLTTAEYYGEVTHAWADVFKKTSVNKLEIDYRKIYKAIRIIGEEIPLKEKSKSWSERWKAFQKSSAHKGKKNKRIYRELRDRSGHKGDDVGFLWTLSTHAWTRFEGRFSGQVRQTAFKAKTDTAGVREWYNSAREIYIQLSIQIPRQLKANNWEPRSNYFKKKYLKGKENREFSNGYMALRRLTEYNRRLRPNQDFLQFVYENTESE